ncbi:MAG: hypothetical protein HYW14_02265 [Planctomycetes bacterium]|nr:hypothetical protein [Planctomycetota bacterium]
MWYNEKRAEEQKMITLGARDFFRLSLKEYARESQKRVFTSIPPELVFIKKGCVPEYNIFHELDFIHKITTAWTKPAIDTSYFALQIKNKIGEPLIEDEKAKIMEFVKSLYREDEKGFVQTELYPHASIHSIHSAIGIVNLLYSRHRDNNNRVDLSKPIGKKLLEEHLGKEKVDSILKFVCERQEKGGGFVECPFECYETSNCPHSIPTINATASALWCLWHLEALDKCNKKSLSDFTMRHVVEENNKIGFKNEEKDKRAWLCATYYGFRILREDNLLDSIIPPNKRKKVIDFIIQCKNGEKGFGAARNLKSTILHTKDALSMIKDKKYGLDFDEFIEEKKLVNFKEKLIEDIESFLTSCEFKGVYGFAEKEHYFPNVYATLLAIEIKEALKIMKNEEPEEEIDENQKKAILCFLASCRAESGGYRGYSLDPNYIPPEWWETKKSNRSTSLEKARI